MDVKRIERDLADYLTADLNQTITEPLKQFIANGGKRLRPKLLYYFLEAFGEGKSDQYTDLALVIELAHNATLVIDDIEDSSVMRRGKPTMHEEYGLDVAANTGVFMHLLPTTILLKNRAVIDSDKLLELVKIYSEEMLSVYKGQALDIDWHKSEAGEIAENEYLEMCRFKTGALIRMPARFACLLSDQNEKTTKKVLMFAEDIAVAFQIRDDILDLTADPEKFGKAYGNDITEGKKSLPVIYALKMLDPAKGARLLEILSLKTRDLKLIGEARDIILSTEAVARAQAFADGLVVDSWEEVKHFFASERDAEPLNDLVNQLVSREK